MCLAVPGRVIEWVEHEALFARARIEFDGVSRSVNMQCVPEAVVDDYVLVHAGVAISRIDREEAERILLALEELELAETDDDGEIVPGLVPP